MEISPFIKDTKETRTEILELNKDNEFYRYLQDKKEEAVIVKRKNVLRSEKQVRALRG
jgi:hypothetical protein